MPSYTHTICQFLCSTRLALPAVLLALLAPHSPTLFAQIDIDPQPASLQLQRTELEREIKQLSEALTQLLPAGAKIADSDNSAIVLLAGARQQRQQQLVLLAARERQAQRQQLAAQPTTATIPYARQSSAVIQGGTQLDEVGPIAPALAQVNVLLNLLTDYHSNLAQRLLTEPSPEDLARRDTARQDAQQLARTPFDSEQVLLSGAEGMTAMALITDRLSDARIAETRLDWSVTCGITTRLFNALISSETHRLTPVGKNGYVAKLRLQPGETSLRIGQDIWQLHLSETGAAENFLVTVFLPPQQPAEIHVFSVSELLSQQTPYIPAWLPDELALTSRSK